MSFLKAEKLVSLATLSSAHHRGVTIEDVRDRFSVSRRTAQRMLKALEVQFPDVVTSVDDEGRKRWSLHRSALKDFLTITPEELTALDLARQALQRSGSIVETEQLQKLREKILALIPRARVARLETDHEALLEAHGFVARPGPRPRQHPEIAATLTEAIKGARILEILYKPAGRGSEGLRQVAPYGILTGLRRYLVAQPKEASGNGVKLYLVDHIERARILDEYFVREPAFDLQAFAQRSFGVFQSDEEYGEVILKFSPAAAERARAYEFHPTQTIAKCEDGSLVVRFMAGGLLEMTWHLYIWGDHVEVLAPERLRDMVHPFRRSDFDSLP